MFDLLCVYVTLNGTTSTLGPSSAYNVVRSRILLCFNVLAHLKFVRQSSSSLPNPVDVHTTKCSYHHASQYF